MDRITECAIESSNPEVGLLLLEQRLQRFAENESSSMLSESSYPSSLSSTLPSSAYVARPQIFSTKSRKVVVDQPKNRSSSSSVSSPSPSSSFSRRSRLASRGSGTYSFVSCYDGGNERYAEYIQSHLDSFYSNFDVQLYWRNVSSCTFLCACGERFWYSCSEKWEHDFFGLSITLIFIVVSVFVLFICIYVCICLYVSYTSWIFNFKLFALFEQNRYLEYTTI